MAGSNRARSITQKTRQRLYGLSGNQCAFPGCSQHFFNVDDEANLSNICHIEAAEEGGQRYNPNSNDDYRRSFENLILLCPNHHKITDDTSVYTVEVLQKMKRDHEKIIREHSMVGQNTISNNPSILTQVINILGSQLFDNSVLEETENAPNPEEKIRYNNVLEYKSIIEEYRIYHGKLGKIYQEIENQGSTKKEFLLKNINALYLREKSKYASIEEIRNNADLIFESIKNRLWDKIQGLDSQIPVEAVEISILIIMVDAFMRCEILEEPKQ